MEETIDDAGCHVATDETNALISSDKVEARRSMIAGENFGSIHFRMIDKVSGRLPTP
jgi:hypothetical protein